LTITLLVALGVHTLLLLGELGMPHSNAHVRLAAEELTGGRLRRPFWLGAAGIGILVAAVLAALALAGLATPVTGGAAGVLALAGLLIYEDVWVTAGQSVPMS
jgi:formate-dependent nitrite reductase membrane component NrfD